MTNVMGIAICPVCHGTTIEKNGNDCHECRTTGAVDRRGEISYEDASAYMRWYEEQRKGH